MPLLFKVNMYFNNFSLDIRPLFSLNYDDATSTTIVHTNQIDMYNKRPTHPLTCEWAYTLERFSLEFSVKGSGSMIFTRKTLSWQTSLNQAAKLGELRILLHFMFGFDVDSAAHDEERLHPLH